MEGLNVFVVGATGAVGKALVRELLVDGRVRGVTTLGRRNVDAKVTETLSEDQRSKLKEVVVSDLGAILEQEEEKAKFAGFDAGFCCLGTTRKDAGSAEAFRKVDYDYVTNVAQAARYEHLLEKKGAIKLTSGPQGQQLSALFAGQLDRSRQRQLVSLSKDKGRE